MRPSKRNIIKMDVRKISVVCEDFKATEPNHNRDWTFLTMIMNLKVPQQQNFLTS